MISTRPYLIRAIYEWTGDSGLTPHILVDTTHPEVHVPNEFIEDNKIILNIAASAVVGLELGNDSITFNARFGGVARDIFVPVEAVRAIYARENGMGIVLPDEPTIEGESPQNTSAPEVDSPVKAPHLKVIK